jgi:hypothetical protein
MEFFIKLTPDRSILDYLLNHVLNMDVKKLCQGDLAGGGQRCGALVQQQVQRIQGWSDNPGNSQVRHTPVDFIQFIQSKQRKIEQVLAHQARSL